MEEYNQNTNQDISNEAVDKYFESGGEEAPEHNENDSQEERQQPDDNKPEEQAENPIERNHKIALQEERERRKEYQKQLQQEQQMRVQMENRFQQFVEKMSQPQQPQYQEPTYEDDPINYLLHQQQKTQYVIQQQQQVEQQRAYEQEMQRRLGDFVNQYAMDAQKFTQNTPDFNDAYKYMIQNRTEELRAFGYSEAQVKTLLYQDELAIAAKAYEDGVNPAERMYAAAKYRGFKSGNQISDNAKKVNDYNRARENTYSLNSGGGGKSGSSGLTLEAIAAMSDEDFGNLPKGVWDKLMKGK